MKVDHKHFRAIMSLASVDESRWVINGVFVEPVEKGNLLVATDGRRLGALFVEGDPEKKSFIVPSWVFKFVPFHISPLEIDLDKNGKDITIRGPGMPVMTCEAIEGDYPRWRQVIPKKFAHADINLAAPILEPFIKCAKFICPAQPHLHFRTTESNLDGICIFLSNPLFIGVIMPVRLSGDDPFTVPSWAQIKEEPAKHD